MIVFMAYRALMLDRVVFVIDLIFFEWILVAHADSAEREIVGRPVDFLASADWLVCGVGTMVRPTPTYAEPSRLGSNFVRRPRLPFFCVSSPWGGVPFQSYVYMCVHRRLAAEHDRTLSGWDSPLSVKLLVKESIHTSDNECSHDHCT